LEKKLYRNVEGDIHFGINAPEGYVPCEKLDVKLALGKKKLWRCNVCNDLHLGNVFPNPCPNCMAPNSYVEISKQEFVLVIGL